ncbi:hypothetical protein CSB11_00090 [Candidatus Campbellbacteria bacterium]|nr:MAG: hypothetical protein CSB11_00090 [Candidatus Campbellbacteria bacterium]
MNKKKKKENQKGFVILIAIVVSALLVSLGVFITNIAFKELQLSTSIKESQRAFYIADSVIECALNFENNDLGFAENETDYDQKDTDPAIVWNFNCNGFDFEIDTDASEFVDDLDSSHCPPPPAPPATPAACDPINKGYAISVYYVSFADDLDGDGELKEDTEIEDPSQESKPYAKLIVNKVYNDAENDIDTTLTTYGHNKYLGAGIVERALQVEY